VENNYHDELVTAWPGRGRRFEAPDGMIQAKAEEILEGLASTDDCR